MKNWITLVIAILIVSTSSVMAFEKTWTIGNEDINATTYVKGTKTPSLIEAEAGGYAIMFGYRADAFLIKARADETSGYYSAKIGPYNYSGSSVFTKSWSGTILEASQTYMVSIVPVTVSGKIAANASITLSVGIKYIKVTATAAGTGNASAAAGITGWKAGIVCEFNPILGGEFTALSAETASFTVEALHIYLKAFVDYLFGAGHYERQIASYGPVYKETFKLW